MNDESLHGTIVACPREIRPFLIKKICQIAPLILLFSCLTSNGADVLDPSVEAESKKANAFFEKTYNEGVDRYPEWQSYLGIKKDYGAWNDYSEEASLERFEQQKGEFKELLETIDYDLLDPQTQISYRMAKKNYEDRIRNFKYRHYNYPVNQMFGFHSGKPAFLINTHLVTDLSDAEAYISRLSKLDEVFAQKIEGLKIREGMGILPPRFVFPHALDACHNIISGVPFETGATECALLVDFKEKVAALDLDLEVSAALLERAKEALINSVKPAYESLIAFLEEQSLRATDESGAWKSDDDDRYDRGRDSSTRLG